MWKAKNGQVEFHSWDCWDFKNIKRAWRSSIKSKRVFTKKCKLLYKIKKRHSSRIRNMQKTGWSAEC
jgi:hypothetical protein